MAASVIGALRVNLGLDSAQFERGAKRSQNTLAGMRKQFLVVAGAAAAMGAALSTAALRGAQDIDRVAKSARRVESSIGGFRAMELAAGELGVSVESLTDTVQTMDREVAKGSKAAGQALNTLRLNAKQLEGLDADQKMALIADSIQDVGLSTAHTSVVLQQLGIRNREMVLALGAGGEAFRQARKDIQDYGLAISRVDSDKIEKANDQIGRLGLISQYAGQQLAVALVPAMGRLAEVMTNSLREGGLLRETIDGLVNNLDVLAAATGAAVVIMGTRYVAAMALARGATVSFSTALAVARGAVVALTGPIGLLYGAIGLAAAAFISYRNSTNQANMASAEAVEAAATLGTELGILSGNDLPTATAKTVDLANANLTLARSAYAAAEAQMELAKANAQAAFDQMSMENAFLPGTENPGQAIYKRRLEELTKAGTALRRAQEELNAKVKDGEKVKVEASEVVKDLAGNMRDLEEASSGGGSGGSKGGAAKALDEAKTSAELFAEELQNNLTNAVQGVSEAFGTFIVNGMKDFKGFTKTIFESFKGLLASMIATAARNRIMISLGMGGSVAGTAANAAGGAAGIAGTLGSLGTLASGIGTGLSGVLGGGGIAAGVSGGLAAGGAAGIGTAIGAALPILAPLAIAGFLVGRRRRRRERRRAAAEAQRQAEEQARLAEEQRQQGIAQQRYGLENRLLELQGDTNALREREIATLDESNQALARQIFALEDATRRAQERTGIERQLLELQGDTARLRELDLAAVDASNRALLQRVFALQDELDVTEERNSLETRLLQLQGNTNELRRRELEALNPANRALQQMIWGLEDAAKAMNSLNPERFASLFDFQRAQALANNGFASANLATAPMVTPATTAPVVTDGATVVELRTMNSRMQRMEEELRQYHLTDLRQGKKTSDTLERWEAIGLPVERTS